MFIVILNNRFGIMHHSTLISVSNLNDKEYSKREVHVKTFASIHINEDVNPYKTIVHRKLTICQIN